MLASSRSHKNAALRFWGGILFITPAFQTFSRFFISNWLSVIGDRPPMISCIEPDKIWLRSFQMTHFSLIIKLIEFLSLFPTDKRFLCLGSWDHFDSNSPDKFLALMDMNEDPVDRPKYRCGVSCLSFSDSCGSNWHYPIYPILIPNTNIRCYYQNKTKIQLK